MTLKQTAYASMKLTWTTSISLLVAGSMSGAAPAAAADTQPWAVKGELLGKVKRKKVETAEDISGMACVEETALPRLCLVVDDETQGAQIVMLNDNSLTAGEFIRLSKAEFAGKPVELDAEAVAFAKQKDETGKERSYFYVTGSHGRARKEGDKPEDPENIAKAEASRFIYRIELQPPDVDPATGQLRNQPGVTPGTLTSILRSIPEIADAHDKPLAKNGLTIEGLAAHAGQLYIGLREPVIGDAAAVIVVDAASVFEGAQAAPRLHTLKLGVDSRQLARGIRDIVRFGDGFLVLAGPVIDPKDKKVNKGDYAIYVWDGTNQPDRHADLAAFDDEDKPETLLPLVGDTQRARVLLLFDGADKGAPTAVDVEFKQTSAARP